MSLNQLPWFKMGMHDRTPLAMINGCVSITDESRYMRERIPDGCGVVYYSLEDMEKAIILLWLDEYAYDEIGDTLGMKRNTVATKIRRIKDKLSKFM